MRFKIPPLIPSRFRTLAAGLIIGLISLAIPLLRDFHWESAGLASLIITFYAAVLASGGKENTLSTWRKCTGLIIGWAIPLILFALFTNCMSFDGVAFWLAGPFPSILLGWSIGRLVLHFKVRKRKTVICAVILSIAILPTLYEFLHFPQLYFFNHVWSYWPGPIYDEIVSFDSRLLLFRGITLFWVTTLWAIPHMFDQKIYRWIAILSLLSIIASYLHATEWGLVAPEERLQAELGALHETDHFKIFYTAGTVEPEELEQWEQKHEQFLKDITETLEIDLSLYHTEKIHSYIYDNQTQKKWLTGAGQTSYVPVWISQDQMHIARINLNRVLKHELVHIVAKQFGNWFGASSSIGMIEGLAVALDPDRYKSTLDQLVAAQEPWPDSFEIRRVFTPVGFYTSAGPISYLLSGSFVQFLLENYPVEKFKEAYRTGNLDIAYSPTTLEEVTAEWHRHLETVELAKEDRARSAFLFKTPSIFEKPCPRVERVREIRDQLTMGDGFSQITMINEESYNYNYPCVPLRTLRE